MLLVVGLGNTGAKYAANRHNIGFMVVDELVRTYRLGRGAGAISVDCPRGVVGGRKDTRP